MGISGFTLYSLAQFTLGAGAMWVWANKKLNDAGQAVFEDALEKASLQCRLDHLKAAVRDALPHLKSIPRMQDCGFHLARTNKELEKRLAKFGPKPRDLTGRFLKGQ